MKIDLRDRFNSQFPINARISNLQNHETRFRREEIKIWKRDMSKKSYGETNRSKAKQWLSDKDYSFVYSRTPRLCLDMLIFTDDGFILTERGIHPYRGMWHFPGGGVLYRESLEEAMNRLAGAEVGVSVKKLSLLGYCEVIREKKTFRHSVSIVFAAEIRSGSLRESEQARKIKLFKRIPQNTIPEQKKFMREYWREIKKIMDSRKLLRK